jgi:hypothetical protein
MSKPTRFDRMFWFWNLIMTHLNDAEKLYFFAKFYGVIQACTMMNLTISHKDLDMLELDLMRMVNPKIKGRKL